MAALRPNLPLPHLQVPPDDQDHLGIAERVRLGSWRRCRAAPLFSLPVLFRRRPGQRRRQFRKPLLEGDESVREPLLVGELGQRAADPAVGEQPEGQAVARGGAEGRAGGEGSGGIGRRR